MDDAAGVGRHQPLGDPVRDDHQVARRGAAALEQSDERRAVDVVHHQVDVALGAAAAVGVAHDRVVEMLRISSSRFISSM